MKNITKFLRRLEKLNSLKTCIKGPFEISKIWQYFMQQTVEIQHTCGSYLLCKT